MAHGGVGARGVWSEEGEEHEGEVPEVQRYEVQRYATVEGFRGESSVAYRLAAKR
jgi:hypothetical protein